MTNQHPDPTPADPWPPRTWVCTGRLPLKGGKLGVGFIELVTDRPLNAMPRWALEFKGRLKQARPGAVYSIEATDTRCRPDTLTYQHMWEDEDQLVAWQTASRAAEIAHRAHKLMQKETTRNVLDEVVAPLRREYRSTDRLGRLALEVLLLNELRYGS